MRRFTLGLATLALHAAAQAAPTSILFVGNSYTFGRVDPVMSYNAANVRDLTAPMAAANGTGSNPFEPHPWGGVAGIFKQFTVQAGLDYDVALSTRNAASLRGHLLNTNPAGWDLRGNIGSQTWSQMVVQEQSDEPLTARPGLASNPTFFRGYADKIEDFVHNGAADSFRDRDLFPGATNAEKTAACMAATGAATSVSCNTVRNTPANANASAATQMFLYQTWSRPNLVDGALQTVTDPVTGAVTRTGNPATTFFNSLEAMTDELRLAYDNAQQMSATDGTGGYAGVARVGEAFMRAVAEGSATRDMWAADASTDGLIDLWFDDGTHASAWGSYLSALTIYGTVTGRNPYLLGSYEIAAQELGISSRDAVALQRIAAQQLGYVVPAPGTLALAALALALLAGCASRSKPPPSGEAAPQAVACPKEVPAGIQCLGGRDSTGAHVLIALPEDRSKWSGVLVLHAHGGPLLGEPRPERAVEDLQRWVVMVKAGHAWAGSTFRQGGVEVRAAAEDTERLRGIFRQHIGRPGFTILHGQSWGAGVAAKAAETYTAETVGQKPYDAVLLTAGVLAGGTRSYDFRTDLRVVYQYLCGNHPRPTEAQYPLNLGLPAGVTMTQAELAVRVNECLALDKPAAQRSAEQAARISTIEKVIKIPTAQIQAHLNWGTFHFQDISSKRTGGASPFGNTGAMYSGSTDDAALNAGVQRYRADATAYQRLATDTDPTGKIPVPVLSAKWVNDPTAFAELDSHFKTVMQQGGSAERLVQTFVSSAQSHSYISDPTYPTLLAALVDWAEKGVKPTPAGVAAACPGFEAQFGSGCSFAPNYTPAALELRVPARERP